MTQDARTAAPDEAFARLSATFAAAMRRLDPFEPRPRLAVAVSGGADSMALAVLALEWARSLDGDAIALTVDHGLRPEAAAEADLTLRRLAILGCAGRKLTATDLAPGPALAERARETRYRLLCDACAAFGAVHLLLGHHRGDQAETVMMRALSASGGRGLAGMPALAETATVRLLRPLLDVAPGQLRAMLTARGIAWIEDPSNQNPAALRTRLRLGRADPEGTGEGTGALVQAARLLGQARAEQDRRIARALAARATIRPEGYALLTPGPIAPEALAALLRMVAGTAHAPPADRVASIARAPGPATLGGVRIAPAGRLGPGWLLVREARAMAAAAGARVGDIWDGRFRLTGVPPDGCVAGLVPPGLVPFGLSFGPLGADAVRFRDRSGLPALILRGLPAVRAGGALIAVPHLAPPHLAPPGLAPSGLAPDPGAYLPCAPQWGDSRWTALFDPRNPASGAPFSHG